MASSKCGARINFKRRATRTPPFAVMGAVEKKAPGDNWRQSFE